MTDEVEQFSVEQATKELIERSRDCETKSGYEYFLESIPQLIAAVRAESHEGRIRDVICPQCRKPFELNWNDYAERKQTLMVRSCPSGGIYDVFIECPHCNYHEDL